MKYFIDFEATQFSERIISIGCVAENGATFKTLVKPVKKEDKVNSFITKLTGITNEMLADAPTANEAFNALFDFVLEHAEVDKASEFYCYGNNDKQFIDRTASHMTDTRAIMCARGIQATLQDYSTQVKSYFQIKNEIGLRKAYILVQNENVEQKHDALEDALMLFAVASNMKTNCKPEDGQKLAAIAKEEKPTADNRVKRAPEQFINWPNNKWDADTGADESNWVVACHVGPHSKYFDSKETAVLWVLRYVSKNLSVKNLTHRETVLARLEEGFSGKKMPWGFSWTLKNTITETDKEEE